jgi:hypothetical protein
MGIDVRAYAQKADKILCVPAVLAVAYVLPFVLVVYSKLENGPDNAKRTEFLFSS